MPVPYTRGMHNTCTYWAPGIPDGEGGKTYGAPQIFACRWQRKTTTYRAPVTGELRVGDHVVYISGEVLTGGYLAEGDQTAAASPQVADAKTILSVQKSPSFAGDRELIKVIA